MAYDLASAGAFLLLSFYMKSNSHTRPHESEDGGGGLVGSRGGHERNCKYDMQKTLLHAPL